MRSSIIGLAGLALVLVVAPQRAKAAPGYVPFQGVLTEASGAPIDGATTVHFRLYPSGMGGDPVWEATRDLDVEGGLFTAYLGEVEALDLDLFRDYPDLHLAVQVDGDAEMDRIPLGAAGYAGFADHCGDAMTLGGQPAATYVQAAGDGLALADGKISLAVDGCGAGDVLQRSQANDGWVCAPLPSGDDVPVGDGLATQDGQIVLQPASAEQLGGVKAKTCAVGDVVVGIDTAGEVLCGSFGEDQAEVPAATEAPLALSSAPQFGMHPILLADGWLYWREGSTIQRLPVAGGIPEQVHEMSGTPSDLAVGSGYVFWSVDGMISRQSADGSGEAEQAATVPGTIGLTATDEYLYAAHGDGVVRIPLGGGALTPVSGVPVDARTIALDGDWLYVAGDDGIARVDLDGGGSETLYHGRVSRVSVDSDTVVGTVNGGSAVVLDKTGGPARVYSHAYDAVVVGGHVYWAGEQGVITEGADGVRYSVWGREAYALISDGSYLYAVHEAPGSGPTRNVYRIPLPW